ncbi:hypothetical protein TA3x_001634 [Tundrisphaera sp. TA3]|uniref:hypothetical protein n=1 Tax=Tundrisphaera sp. TA3 TaxID=3435775 RepID=UPI003EBE34F5
MNAEAVNAVPSRIAGLLSVLSVLGFWILPFSPLVAIGAVATTRGTSGRTRRLAVAGASLCIAHTALMAALFVRHAVPLLL